MWAGRDGTVVSMNLTRLTSLSSCAVALSLALAPVASARVRSRVRPVETIDLSVLTWTTFRGRNVYVPGTGWIQDVQEKDTTLTKESINLMFKTIPKEDCAYTRVITRARRAWGGERLLQSEARVETLKLGKSGYGGFSWIVPDKNRKPEYHFCLGQDAKDSVEASFAGADAAHAGFFNQNLTLQFAARRAVR